MCRDLYGLTRHFFIVGPWWAQASRSMAGARQRIELACGGGHPRGDAGRWNGGPGMGKAGRGRSQALSAINATRETLPSNALVDKAPWGPLGRAPGAAGGCLIWCPFGSRRQRTGADSLPIKWRNRSRRRGKLRKVGATFRGRWAVWCARVPAPAPSARAAAGMVQAEAGFVDDIVMSYVSPRLTDR